MLHFFYLEIILLSGRSICRIVCKKVQVLTSSTSTRALCRTLVMKMFWLRASPSLEFSTWIRSGWWELPWNFTWNFTLLYTVNIRNACSFLQIPREIPGQFFWNSFNKPTPEPTPRTSAGGDQSGWTGRELLKRKGRVSVGRSSDWCN